MAFSKTMKKEYEITLHDGRGFFPALKVIQNMPMLEVTNITSMAIPEIDELLEFIMPNGMQKEYLCS